MTSTTIRCDVSSRIALNFSASWTVPFRQVLLRYFPALIIKSPYIKTRGTSYSKLYKRVAPKRRRKQARDNMISGHSSTSYVGRLDAGRVRLGATLSGQRAGDDAFEEQEPRLMYL
jgi:hypothetical protein